MKARSRMPGSPNHNRPKGVSRFVLSSFANNIALCPAEKYPCTNADGFIVRVVAERIKLSCARECCVSKVRKKLTHICVDSFISAICCTVVALIAVAEVQQVKLVQIVLSKC